MNGGRKIRLLLADVDGTLVTTEKKLTEAAKAAAEELQESGIAFAITSSRPPRGMRMLIEPLAIKHPISGFNGGMFVDPNLSVIEKHPLSPSIALETVTLLRDRRLEVWLYTQNEWLVLNPDAPHVAHEAYTLQFGPRVVEHFAEDDLTQAMKIVGISDDHDLVADAEAVLQKTLGGNASAERSQAYFLDVTAPEANKGEVVKRLSQLLDIPTPEIATIGDMPNDVLMFRQSGFSIAMGNASDAVKAQACATTDTNDAEGFAKAVRTLLLNRGNT